MAIATVILFWTPVEIMGRINIFKEIWIEPMEYMHEMTIILITLTVLSAYLWVKSKHKT